LIHPGIEVGRHVRVGKSVRLFLDPGAALILGDGCEVDDGTTIAVYGTGCIELGRGSFVGHRCTLAAHRSIVLGHGAFLAELVSVRDHDHLVGTPPSSGRIEISPVKIGVDSWIGSKATIIRGAKIGDRAVVGANSVVRGELPANTLCAGIPATVIRTLNVDQTVRGRAERGIAATTVHPDGLPAVPDRPRRTSQDEIPPEVT
jgi:acetyltransferase-like isoleucine patch superfamily enzyme